MSSLAARAVVLTTYAWNGSDKTKHRPINNFSSLETPEVARAYVFPFSAMLTNYLLIVTGWI